MHLFLDGRDTPPQSAEASLERLTKLIQPSPNTRIHSICGRYYALDRDMRWDRVAPVYQLLTEGYAKNHFNHVNQALQHFYQQGIHDEFIPPTQLSAEGQIHNGDGILSLSHHL